MSKLLKILVASQLVDYLNNVDLFPEYQSIYRASCSTETATAKVLSNVLTALDGGDIVALALLGSHQCCRLRHPAPQAS
jgi:hypothetical protein